MGQLERYGLYVLCLVIFLILGVAIWGGDPAQTTIPDNQGTLSQVVQDPPGDAPADTDFFDKVAAETTPVPDAQLGLETVIADAAATPADKEKTVSSPPVVPVKAEEPVAKGYREYKIKKGDVLGKIAQRELGSADQVKAIRELNPGVEDKKMQVGQLLRLPVAAKAAPSAAPSAAPKVEASSKTYKVLDGESPWVISRKVFGTAKYADEIMKLNGIRNAKSIKAGAILKLPERQ